MRTGGAPRGFRSASSREVHEASEEGPEGLTEPDEKVLPLYHEPRKRPAESRLSDFNGDRGPVNFEVGSRWPPPEIAGRGAASSCRGGGPTAS